MRDVPSGLSPHPDHWWSVVDLDLCAGDAQAMIKDFIRKTNKYTHRHSPLIMTGIGVVGVATTAYLSAAAAFKAARAIDEDEAKMGISNDPTQRFKEQARLTWKFYIPPVTTGIVTVGAIAYANKLGSKRTAAAVSAYTLTERAFAQYRDKVVEEIGSHKEQVIRDDIARAEVAKKTSETIILAGSGEVLCCELYTHRYFMSSMENLRKAQNDINAMIMSELYISLDEFYYAIGLPSTAHSAELGWDSDKLMELEFSTVLTEDGRPCLSFNYNYIKPI